MQAVEGAEQVEEVEDKDVAAESRFTRKLASLGMAAWNHYTPRRIQSEYQAVSFPTRPWLGLPGPGIVHAHNFRIPYLYN